jgi:hypothetical protein
MVRTHNFDGFSRLQLSPRNEKSTLHFRLTFRSSYKTDVVQFELPSGHVMEILSALQAMQRKHGWPLPSHAGKPDLTIVSSDDD